MHSSHLEETIWQQMQAAARAGGLDATKFDEPHREVVRLVAQFLARPPASASTNGRPRLLDRLANTLFNGQEEQEETAEPVAPIILSGVPGTGKTTFLYLLDAVLRSHLALPDHITPTMPKQDGTRYQLQKRYFCGRPISLLSVRKWTELLYFYQWDINAHGFNEDDLEQFIHQKLKPMRILFADEVEMTGYSPTLPNLAKHGILVVGTSNQAEFAQLDSYLIQPRIISFSGEDMRSGNPEDAIITELDSTEWNLFKLMKSEEERLYNGLTYRARLVKETAVVLVPFYNAINAPLLESGWIDFFHSTYRALTEQEEFTDDSQYLLLLEQFSLAQLQGNFNAIIRFVTLFDVIEQFGIGVLLRNTERVPRLSRDAIHQMKVAIKTRPGVDAEIKSRTLAGIDRWTSRLGQAGHKAAMFDL